MTIELDHFDVHQKRLYVIIATAIGFFISHASTILRVWSKFLTMKRLGLEDWFMIIALLLSYGVAVSLCWGLSTGLAQNASNISGKERDNFLLSIWVIQRFQPPSLFFVKTSIILFYLRLFDTRKFRIIAWVVWAYTLLWTIGSWLASTLECLPVSYFWDKQQKGSCVKDPLINIGLTDGVLSCFGDILIFSMPIPVLKKLQMNHRKKYALMGIFAIGILVIITSFIRWIALLGTAVNVTSTQAEAGIWTYLEIATGITCGNLPLLTPIFRRFLSTNGGSASGFYSPDSANRTLKTSTKRSKTAKMATLDGFERIEESPSGSEIELQHRHQYANSTPDPHKEIDVSTQADINAKNGTGRSSAP